MQLVDILYLVSLICIAYLDGLSEQGTLAMKYPQVMFDFALPISMIHYLALIYRQNKRPCVFLQLPLTPKLSCLDICESSVTIPDVPLIYHLYNCLHIQPVPVLIHRLIDKCFLSFPLTPPPVQQTVNYALADLTNLYTKYRHKRTKHVLL